MLSLLTCSACCDTSKGCCGDPPNPELTPEAKAWLSVYQQKEYFVYKDQNNRRDTLWVTFETDTEYCGGDECGSDCKIERALLASSSDTTINFDIAARYNTKIEMNERRFSLADSTLIFVEYSLTNGYIGAIPDDVDVELMTDYVFQGQEVTAIKAQCDSVNPCEGFRMTALIVSKEKGLLAFVDNGGRKWTLTE